jgi:hypothetical protein
MLPVETRLALFPRRSLVCRLGAFRRITLRPVTLERAAVMESLGCGFLEGRLDAGKAIVAAWVLSLPERELAGAGRGETKGLRKFIAKCERSPQAVADAARLLIDEAIKPFIPAKPEKTGWTLDDGIPRGCGWPLEVAEAVCAAYGWSMERTMRTEMQTVFALLAVCRARVGGEHGGPDYYEKIRLDRLRRLGLIGKGA